MTIDLNTKFIKFYTGFHYTDSTRLPRLIVVREKHGPCWFFTRCDKFLPKITLPHFELHFLNNYANR